MSGELVLNNNIVGTFIRNGIIFSNRPRIVEKVLWTNPNPTATFASQIAELSDSIDNYDQIKLIYRKSTTDTTLFTTMTTVKDWTTLYLSGATDLGYRLPAEAIVNSAGNYRAATCVSTNHSQVQFGNVSGGGGNTYIIPVQIIGIKEEHVSTENETVLWTNSDPTTDFAAQTVTLSDNISNYKYIGIKYCYAKTNTDDIVYTAIYKTEEVRASVVDGAYIHNVILLGIENANNYTFARLVGYVNDASLRITPAYRLNAASSIINGVIPLEIIGVNKLAYKPDDYIVTSGTFAISSLGTPVTVTLGFKPKKFTVWRASASNNFESFTYDDRISTTNYTKMQVVNGGNISGGTRNVGQTKNNDLISINDDGFTLASTITTGTWNYFATGIAE